MKAMVLAAGLGTRLRPMTLERPKPAVPFGLRPLACVALDALARIGIREVVLNTHHLPERLEALLVPHAPEGMQLTFLHEPTLLGTGGGLHNAREHLGEGPIVVMNSDIVFSPNLEQAVKLHQQHDAIATMVVRRDPDASRFGLIEVDEGQRVRRILGEPDTDRALQPRMFTGVHVLSPRALASLPEQGCVIRKGYQPWLAADEVVCGWTEESAWSDLGTLHAYLDESLRLVADHTFRDHNALVHDSATIHPDAVLDRVIVGRGAQVGAVELRDCIVWPESNVTRSYARAVVGAEQSVELGADA